MAFDQELAQTTETKKPAPSQDRTVGKTTTVDQAPTTKSPETTEQPPEARLAALVQQLEKEFVRRPGQAKQTALTMSIEFPDRFDAAWVIDIYAKIDDAVWRKTKVERVLADWDDKPGVAKAAIAELKAKYPSDKALAKWAAAMVKQIDAFQHRLELEAAVRAWDRRPSPAQDAARELHRLYPKSYPTSWLNKLTKQIWDFQDVKWAERVSPAELTAALGDNIIDWDEAPDEVKFELQKQLGRQKANQYYGKGGLGAKDTRVLVQTEQSRTQAMSSAEKVSSTFQFTKKEDIPVKRLDKIADQYDKKADELTREVPCTDDTSPLSITQKTDVFQQLFDNVMNQQAKEYRERGAAYRALYTRIQNKETTIASERQLVEKDLIAIDNELRNLYPQLRAYEKEGKTDEAAASQKQIDQLLQHEKFLQGVLADPDGVVPGAGQIAKAYPGPSMQAATPEDARAMRQAAATTDFIEGITGGPNPTGVGKNMQEMLVGLTRFQGRIYAFEAGLTRMIGNLGSYVLPESLSSSILGTADQMKALAFAFQSANTKMTKEQEASAGQYTKAGGEIPLIDRVFSNQKIFEKPEVAIVQLLALVPQTRGASLAMQVGINGMQVLEAFFSTYGKTGQLTPSFQAAGWSAVQGAAGMVLDRLGLPASAALIGNITLIYGMGKLRGQSSEQIQEDIAYALVGAAVTSGGTAAKAKPQLEGVGAKSKAIVDSLDEQSAKLPKTDDIRVPTRDELVKGQKVDDAANELATAIEQGRQLTIKLRELQTAKKPTKETLAELTENVKVTKQKRETLRSALGELQTVGTTKIEVTTTDASVVEPTTVKTETETTTKTETEATTTVDAEVAKTRQSFEAAFKATYGTQVRVYRGVRVKPGTEIEGVWVQKNGEGQLVIPNNEDAAGWYAYDGVGVEGSKAELTELVVMSFEITVDKVSRGGDLGGDGLEHLFLKPDVDVKQLPGYWEKRFDAATFDKFDYKANKPK